MGTVIVVTSGKGGTGKTSLTSGVASCPPPWGRKCCASIWTSVSATWTSPGHDRPGADGLHRRAAAAAASLERAAVAHPSSGACILLTAPARPTPPPMRRGANGGHELESPGTGQDTTTS
ncbi:MAG: hypothetical protein ACLRWQ_01695 [Flavonifractor plautii]